MLAAWKAQWPFDDPIVFEQRLRLDNLTEAGLRQLIAEPPHETRRRLPAVPDWVTDIEAALSSTLTYEFHDLLPSYLRRDPTIAFLDVAAPFITLGLRRLTSGAERLSHRMTCPFEPAAVGRLLLGDFAESLMRVISRTMVLELNVARIEGTLVGTSSEERFASFIAQLHDPARLRALHEEYPVLARLIAELTRQWVTVSLELLERVATDFEALERAFAPGATLGGVASVAAGLSDPHDDGRAVAIVRFSSGTRVVYKPKSLAIDRHYQDALDWLTAEGFSPAFRTLTILDRDAYGWVEFASAEPCQSAEAVTRFYERTGGSLALLYVLDATDLHAGNIIASGEHPVLIDLEALLHPHASEPAPASPESAESIAGREVDASTLRIGLLPERSWGNDEHDGVDVSGLGTPEGQLTPHPVAGWEESGTDAMRFVRKRETLDTESNRPVFEGRPVDAIEHRAAMLRGFRSAYSLLAARRHQLLAPDGLLSRFAQDPVSVFLRSSRSYRRLLRESYHPDVLRDALDRDRLFDRLWVEVPEDARLLKVITSEREDLWRGDIPRFASRPESRALWPETGEPLADFFPESSLTSVSRIVNRMGEADCARQAWFIEASLASLPGSQQHWPSYPAVMSSSTSDPSRLIAAAARIGDRLAQLVIRGADDAAWIGLDLERRRVWSIGPTGGDLESGSAGIALFLAYLGALTGHEPASALARSALSAIRRSRDEPDSDVDCIGAFDGLGGDIYVLAHLGALWDRPDLLTEADAVAARLPALIEDDDEFDVFGGAAGCILALRSLQRCRPSDRVTAAAIQCGDHLIASSERTADGLVWRRESGKPMSRTGMAFGTSGIAHALLELHAWTGLERFRAAGHEAFALDGAEPPHDPADHECAAHGGHPTAWCHGVAGDGLSRLAGPSDTLADAGGRARLTALAAAIRDRGFGRDHSLCHGDLGSLEYLTRAAIVLDDDALRRDAGGMAATILADIETNGWRCGTPLGVETPGLLAGLAGIGYGLLRAARPDVVPSVLALEPPLLTRRPHGE